MAIKDVNVLLSKLSKVKAIGDNEYEALCPYHNDKTPSLHIGVADSKILLNCKAGCKTVDVISAIGLTMSDLFINTHSQTKEPLKVVATYHYQDASGKALYDVVRFEPKTFRQRHFDSNNNPVWGLGNIAPVLYHLPDILKAKSSGDTIYLVEGEKDADLLWQNGFVATCNPMGAGKWRPDYTKTLIGARVIMIPDKDEAGRQHAKQVARELEATVEWIKVLELPGETVKDTSDWFANGGDAETLDRMAGLQPRFTTLPIISATDLMQKDFAPVKWVIPDILPDGTTLLCGKPKAGKSVLILNVCIGVAAGGAVLGKINVEQGDVLYLSLEDGERRVKERLSLLLEDGKPPEGLEIACQWARIDEGGIADIEAWLKRHPRARLIAVDTLKRIRPRENVGQTLYGQDYDSIQPLSELAKKWNVSIVINHHLNKMRDADDPMDLISGSTGLTGAVDNAFVVRRGRGEIDAVLYTCGRDIEDRKLALKLEYPCWVLMGDADEYAISEERKEIIDLLKREAGLSPKDIAESLDKDRGNIRFLLSKMVKSDEVRSENGKYYVIC